MMTVRVCIVFLLTIAFRYSFGQDFGSLHVRVIDADSNEPLPYANVYLDQTTIGGFTNEQGEIDMTKIPFGNYTLMVSEISHLPHSRKIVVKDAQVTNVVAKLPVQVLSEVKVEAKKDKQWNRQLERFARLFFGAEHLKDCKFANPWVLDFKVVNGDFIATASEPLKIENNYLGYKVDLNLRNCFFNSSTFAIASNARYQEMQGDEATTSQWKKNREEAYHGSPQHFFTAVINDAVNKEGFEVYRDLTVTEKITRARQLSANINVNIAPDSLAGKVKQLNRAQYAITLPPRLEVHYLRKRSPVTVYADAGHPVSWLEVKKGPVVVNKQGIVQNAEVLSLAGWMSNLRVGDWLPLNYQPSGMIEYVNVARPVTVRKDLLEKAYVQTDRDYYYQTETMWMKGYMNYTVPAMRDTMSQTVYVDLVDPSGKVLVAKRYPVTGSVFQGDMRMERTFLPGLYQLRAYTAWMLNFDPKLIFTKTIRLLQDNEAARVTPGYQPSKDTLSVISLRTDKTSYAPREKIDVTIDVTDSLDFRTASSLSISVTDMNLAVPVKKEKTIMNSYSFGDYNTLVSSPIKYNIEYGIPFSGKFFLGRKPVQGNITVYQDNSVENFQISTADDGRFRRFLLFNDTLNFYFKAISYNNKKGTVVMDTLKTRVPQLTFDPFTLDIYSAGNNKRVHLNEDNVTLLKEVEIKGTKIDKPVSPTMVNGVGDFVISGDWINEQNYQDVFFAIIAKVPGSQYDPSGPKITFISSKYSSYNGGGGAGGPLILVDGVPMDEMQVRSVPVRAIDRIDVLKYGSTATYGVRGGNGVILIRTRTGVSTAPQANPLDKKKLQITKWAGYTVSSRFKSPDYTIPSGNFIQDDRTTIYWSPGIFTDSKQPTTVSFFAADEPTRYRIVVEGLTIGGEPVRAEKVVEVVKGR